MKHTYGRLRALVRIILLGGASGLALSTAFGEEIGERAYQTHCMACHLVDVRAVGPSLVYIAQTYPESSLDEFKKWVKNPGKKDPRMIQMPAMGHVSDADLKDIHSFVLNSTRGKTEKGGSKRFPDFVEPKRPLPYVVRGFFPDASPASVAIVMKNKVSVCWDTEICRIRYIWSNSRTNLNNYFGPNKLQVEPYHKELREPLFLTLSEESPEFLGYRLVDRSPEFHYKLDGGVEVRELVKQAENGEIQRHFTASGITEEIKINLSVEGKLVMTSDSGRVQDNWLTLTPSEASQFTLTLNAK